MTKTATYRPNDFLSGVPLPKGYDGADMVRDGWTAFEIEAWLRALARPWVPGAQPMPFAEAQANFAAELAKRPDGRSAPERAAGGPSGAAAPSPAPEADRPAGGAAGGGAMAHPDLTAMMQRIALLRGSGKVSVDEHARLTSCGESLAILAQRYAPDLDALRHQPLPDPGLRPDASTIHPFAGYQPRNLPMALGYMHRVREYLARLEAKHGTGEGAT